MIIKLDGSLYCFRTLIISCSYLPAGNNPVPPPNPAWFSINSELYTNSELTFSIGFDPAKNPTANPAADEHLFLTSCILFNTTLWSNSPSNPTYNAPPNVRAKFSSNKQFSSVAFEGKDGFTSIAHAPPLPVKANCCNNWVVLCWMFARGSLVLLRKVHLSTLSCGRDESIPSRW